MKNIAKIIVLISAMSTTPAFAAMPSCQDFTSIMTKKVIQVFHDKKQNEVQKRQELSSLFQNAVDTDWIGKFVLGRFWRTASSAEQAQYLTNYRNYITKNYISKFNDEAGLSVDDIVVASLTANEGGQFDAKTIIKRKNEEDVKVDYLLDNNSGECKVHDIKVEGVSLLTSQRSEFSALASSSGVKGVIAAMQKQLAN
jgi:phospholipid transport system substrate-binding protein